MRELFSVYPILHCEINSITNGRKMFHHIQIRDAKDIVSLLLQKSGSPLIVRDSLRFAMMGAVQFYDQPSLITVKINNICANGVLAFEVYGVGF